MVEGLIGRKIGMTQKFDEVGNVIPVTVLKVGPCTVIQKKTEEKDGYAAIQLGFNEEKELRKPNKPWAGHFKKADIPPVKIVREFRYFDQNDIEEGSQFSVDMFDTGEKIHIIGMSKGKGFAGVIKRWGFHGGKGSHGSMFHRRPGSVGASATPSRVVKGKKMPGQMGNEQVTVKNLIVIESDKENNLLIVKGSVPGSNQGYVVVKRADFNEILSGAKKPKDPVKPADASPQDVSQEESKPEKQAEAAQPQETEKADKDVKPVEKGKAVKEDKTADHLQETEKTEKASEPAGEEMAAKEDKPAEASDKSEPEETKKEEKEEKTAKPEDSVKKEQKEKKKDKEPAETKEQAEPNKKE